MIITKKNEKTYSNAIEDALFLECLFERVYYLDNVEESKEKTKTERSLFSVLNKVFTYKMRDVNRIRQSIRFQIIKRQFKT